MTTAMRVPYRYFFLQLESNNYHLIQILIKKRGKCESSGLESPNIFVMQYGLKLPKYEQFEGACVDYRAQKTVIGARKSHFYCALPSEKMEEVGDIENMTFKFGAHKHAGVGTIDVSIPSSPSFFISFDADVVDVDVPLLLGLDVLTSYRMVLNFTHDEVTSKKDNWSLPLV